MTLSALGFGHQKAPAEAGAPAEVCGYGDWLQKVNARRLEQCRLDPWISDGLNVERVSLFIEESEPDGPMQRIKRWFA